MSDSEDLPRHAIQQTQAELEKAIEALIKNAGTVRDLRRACCRRDLAVAWGVLQRFYEKAYRQGNGRGVEALLMEEITVARFGYQFLDRQIPPPEDSTA